MFAFGIHPQDLHGSGTQPFGKIIFQPITDLIHFARFHFYSLGQHVARMIKTNRILLTWSNPLADTGGLIQPSTPVCRAFSIRLDLGEITIFQHVFLCAEEECGSKEKHRQNFTY